MKTADVAGRQKKKKGILYTVYKQRYLLLMLLPTIIGLILFTYKPVLGWIIAFKDYRIGKSIWAGDWTGLDTFREFFVDSLDAGNIFRNTIIMNFFGIAVVLFFAMIFAILLNEVKIKFLKSTVQTFSLFPFFISWVIAYSVMHIFLSVNSGLLNELLLKYNIIPEGINVLGDPQYSWGLVIGASLWKSMGYNTVFFLAAISSIDVQQYEAAEIDGAKRFAKIRYITIPGISGVLIMLIILSSGSLFSSSLDAFYLFTNPTNMPTMEVLDMYVYKFGLKLFRYSYATAVCIVETFINLTMLIIVNAISKKTTNRSLF
jgi:putative aldouronate transport system permease protein